MGRESQSRYEQQLRVRVSGGVHIKSGSVIGLGAIVLPNTVIGPNEFWAGVPAKKIRNLDPPPRAASR